MATRRAAPSASKQLVLDGPIESSGCRDSRKATAARPLRMSHGPKSGVRREAGVDSAASRPAFSPVSGGWPQSERLSDATSGWGLSAPSTPQPTLMPWGGI
jgi:hypothetical protein